MFGFDWFLEEVGRREEFVVLEDFGRRSFIMFFFFRDVEGIIWILFGF